MCSKFIKSVLWIGTKFLLIFGAVTYFVDVGSDVSFSVRLFQNCHINYAIASICMMVFSVFLSMLVPHINMEEDLPRDCQDCFKFCGTGFGYIFNYLRLTMKELFFNNLSEEEKRYVTNSNP